MARIGRTIDQHLQCHQKSRNDLLDSSPRSSDFRSHLSDLHGNVNFFDGVLGKFIGEYLRARGRTTTTAPIGMDE